MMDDKGTLQYDSGKHSLRFERLLAHPREKVWRALTDNDELAGWGSPPGWRAHAYPAPPFGSSSHRSPGRYQPTQLKKGRR